jgi:hypothetical protein
MHLVCGTPLLMLMLMLMLPPPPAAALSAPNSFLPIVCVVPPPLSFTLLQSWPIRADGQQFTGLGKASIASSVCPPHKHTVVTTYTVSRALPVEARAELWALWRLLLDSSCVAE